MWLPISRGVTEPAGIATRLEFRRRGFGLVTVVALATSASTTLNGGHRRGFPGSEAVAPRSAALEGRCGQRLCLRSDHPHPSDSAGFGRAVLAGNVDASWWIAMFPLRASSAQGHTVL